MSQRRKGPGRPPTSSTIPSRPPAPPPRARAVLLPLLLKTRDLPSLRGAPSEPVFESVCPSRPRPTLGRGQGWGCGQGWESRSKYVAPSAPHPVWCLRGCSMFYVFLNGQESDGSPPPPDRGSLKGLRAPPPKPSSALPHRPQEPFFFF